MPLHDKLIIFGRYPVPGKVKTRLIPALGPVGAADLHRTLTEHTLNTAKELAREGTRLEFCHEGGTTKKILRWLGGGIDVASQVKGSLGERMAMAFKKAFDAGFRRVVLIGTDIPGITPAHLREAFASLDEKDIVLGPSEDGGYWLVGMKRPLMIFHDIPWGTEEVLNRTLALAKNNEYKVALLSSLHDIDTNKDLEVLDTSLFDPKKPYLSVIIPALNEEEHILDTIHRAKNPDSEVIVVDGGSTDRTRELACMETTVISSPRGRAIQQNKGASMANGRVLLFLHADTLLPNKYVQEIFERMIPQRSAGGAFRFRTDFDHPLMRLIELGTHIRAKLLKLPYGDQAIFVKRDIFHTLNGFPLVPVAEDLFFVKKLARVGDITISNTPIVTSGRRWKTHGIVKTTSFYLLILLGSYLGLSYSALASIYNRFNR